MSDKKTLRRKKKKRETRWNTGVRERAHDPLCKVDAGHNKAAASAERSSRFSSMRMRKKNEPMRASIVNTASLAFIVKRAPQPHVVPYLLDVRARLGIRVQTPQHERARGHAHARTCRLAEHDATLHRVLLRRERRCPGEEVRQEHAERPYFRGRRLIGLLQQHLRRRVRRRPEEERVERPGERGVDDDGAPKVDELDPQARVDEDVLVLDVAVRHALAIEIVHDVDDLGEDVPRLRFREAFVLRLLYALK